ncbi:polysaccharide deacetylase family protein [Enterococcus hirae]|nr:polysaccharide deacetylase family protein [Enterococcus hirae]
MLKQKFLIAGICFFTGVLLVEVISLRALHLTKTTVTQQTITSSQTIETSKEQELKPSTTTNTETKAQKTIALSFDDGPNGTTTPKLLKILKDQQIHGTFFALGQNIQLYPEVVKQAVMDGNEVGNHSYDHQDLTRLSLESVESELKKTDEDIKKVTGKTAAFVRPPYGSTSNRVAQLIKRPIILWSVDSEDWKTRNSEMIVQRVQNTVHNGAILLFHDIYSETINAMPQIIEYLKGQGYQFKTVGELLGYPTAVECYYGKDDHRKVP